LTIYTGPLPDPPEADGSEKACGQWVRSVPDGSEPRPSGSGLTIYTGPLPHGRGSERVWGWF